MLFHRRQLLEDANMYLHSFLQLRMKKKNKDGVVVEIRNTFFDRQNFKRAKLEKTSNVYGKLYYFQKKKKKYRKSKSVITTR